MKNASAEDQAKVVYEATKEKLDQGYKVLLHLLKHDSVTSVRKLIYAYLEHVKEKLAPLLKLSTWIEMWRHPLTRRARVYVAQVAKLVRIAVEELFRNVLVLLSLANKHAKKLAATKLAEEQKRSYSNLAATILSGLVSSKDFEAEDGRRGEVGMQTDLELQPSPTLIHVSPVPLAGSCLLAGNESTESTPKEDIKSLCNLSVDLIDLNSENRGSPRVPRMWQSYNPEDIKTCAKSTPACRAKYVERSPTPSAESDSLSMATANSSEVSSEVVINTPESVNIDMTVYSTGTPFKENVQNIQDKCQTLDFTKEVVQGQSGLSPASEMKENRSVLAVPFI